MGMSVLLRQLFWNCATMEQFDFNRLQGLSYGLSLEETHKRDARHCGR
jgi:hypothetical protein